MYIILYTSYIFRKYSYKYFRTIKAEVGVIPLLRIYISEFIIYFKISYIVHYI